MSTDKINRPDDRTIKKMTVLSLKTLLNTLRTQRDNLIRPHDDLIKMYEEILEEKLKEANGPISS